MQANKTKTRPGKRPVRVLSDSESDDGDVWDWGLSDGQVSDWTDSDDDAPTSSSPEPTAEIEAAPPSPDGVYGPQLPQGVRIHNPRTGMYKMSFARGGKYYQKFSTDVAELQAWRVAKEDELDAAGVPAARKHTTSARQSMHPGVNWSAKDKRWRGSVHDRLATAAAGTPCQNITSRYVDEHACAAALAVLREAEEREFEAEIAVRVAADPTLLGGLERTPAKVVDAVVGTVYWNVEKQNKYRPYRAVVAGKTDATKQYARACELCAQVAHANPAKPEEGKRFCKQHGGGKRCVGCDPTPNAEVCPSDSGVPTGNRNIYDGRCAKCFCVAFPNDPRAERARKCIHVRERTVMAFVKKAFSEHNWIFDKTVGMRLIGGRSTRERPDARTTVADRVLIVEVDEYSHRGYGCASERAREESFFLQFKGKTVIMIRFNPDGYVDYDGKRHPSCFTPPSKEIGEVHVHPKQAAQWEHRLETLAAAMRTALDPSIPVPPPAPNRHIHVVELFYDNVAATPEEKRLLQAQRKNKVIGKRKRACAEAAAGSGVAG